MEVIGNTVKTLGELMIAYTVIAVHQRVWKEHKIDKAVFTEMERERKVGIIGMVLIIVGFFLELGYFRREEASQSSHESNQKSKKEAIF